VIGAAVATRRSKEPARASAEPKTAEALPTTPARGAAAPQLSFEAAISRLNEIVEALEEGELPLEESLELFEEGILLTRASNARLAAAERRVEKLLHVDRDGAPQVEDFEDTGGGGGKRQYEDA